MSSLSRLLLWLQLLFGRSSRLWITIPSQSYKTCTQRLQHKIRNKNLHNCTLLPIMYTATYSPNKLMHNASSSLLTPYMITFSHLQLVQVTYSQYVHPQLSLLLILISILVSNLLLFSLRHTVNILIMMLVCLQGVRGHVHTFWPLFT